MKNKSLIFDVMKNKSAREKWMIVSSLIILIIFLWFNFFYKEIKEKTEKYNVLSKEKSNLISGVASKIFESKDSLLKKSLSSESNLEEEKIQNIKDEMKKYKIKLIDSDETYKLINGIISTANGVEINSLSNSNPEMIFADKEKSKSLKADFYKHTFLVESSGDFSGNIQIIKYIENSHWLIEWKKINILNVSEDSYHFIFEFDIFSLEKEIIKLKENKT